MILRREHIPALSDPETGRAEPAPQADPIGAWLDVLSALLRLPPPDRAEIREELESHLRDRARDLMLAGASEPDAASRAIAELGSAAQLADRYLAARTRPLMRRHAMQLAVLGLAGAATILSIVAVTSPPAASAPAAVGGQGSQPTLDQLDRLRLLVGGQAMRGATFQPTPAGEALDGEPPVPARIGFAPAGETGRQDQPLSDIAMRAEFSDAPLEQVLDAIVAAAGRPSIIRWPNIESDGRERTTPVTITLNTEVPIDALLRLVNESVDLEGSAAIEYRLTDNILELATRGYFDRRERTLVAYDLSALSANGVNSEQVVQLITGLVEADNWRDNGGDIAEAHLLADRLFITAPPRMHERIRWVLGQLEPADREHAAAEITDTWGTPLLAIPLVGHTFRSRPAK